MDHYDDLIRMLSGKDSDDEMFFGESRRRQSKFNPNNADSEVFTTSEDRELEKIKLEEQFGIRPKQPVRAEESLHFKQYGDPNIVPVYTDEQLQEFTRGCQRVIVHDYSATDPYHMSDEERDKDDELTAIRIKLDRLKRVYRSVDQYIHAMRVVYEAWSILADTNPLHSRKEFFKLVSQGNIVSKRIIFPKFKGQTGYNKEMIMSYISDESLDPADLVPRSRTSSFDGGLMSDDTAARSEEVILSGSELEYSKSIYFDDNMDIIPDIPVTSMEKQHLRAYDDSINYRRRRKKGAPVKKAEKRIRETTTDILKRIQTNNYQRGFYGYSFGIAENLFKHEKNEDPFDRLRYGGSWRDDDSVKLYNLAVDDEVSDSNVPSSEYLTHGDVELLAFYRTLEDSGMNVTEIRRLGNQTPADFARRKTKASKKESQRLESKVIQRIQLLSDNDKFKKLIKRAEKATAEYREGGMDDD